MHTPGKTPINIARRATHMMQNDPQNKRLWIMILGALVNISEWFRYEGYALTKKEESIIARKVNEIYIPTPAAQKK
jgi:hypothetical protein